jgi:UDP-2,3-diacylglucosamine pyrophosphatase LpxH
MRTVILTDGHVGSKESNYRDVKKFLYSLECDELVLGGDFWDLWDMSAKRLRSRHGDVITMLERVRSRGAKITYVVGNHDEDYPKTPVMADDRIIVVIGSYSLPGHARRITLIHGHEFDPVYQDYYWVSRMLAWVNKMSVSTIGVGSKTFMRRTCTDRIDEDDFPDIIRCIHQSAMRAYDGKCDCLIMGHTHSPIHLSNESGMEFVNSGDWKWSNTWVDVVDGVVTLNEFRCV